MKRTVFALSLWAVSSLAFGKIDIAINAKDGDVVSGDRTFRVTVTSPSPVTQVEFYVGDNLSDNDTSTPYEFKLDSLAENDGNLKLTFAAYNTNGESAKKSLTIKVDNGVGKGAAFHIEAGNAALTESKWDAAILSGRIALKADENSVAARIILARAFLAKGELDKAQKFAEDAQTADPKNLTATDLVASIRLRAAFRTTVREGGTTLEAVEAIRTGLVAAIENRKKVLESLIDAEGPVTSANRIRVADLAIRAGRFGLAIEALAPLAVSEPGNTEALNRLAFAQLRASRAKDSQATINILMKSEKLDAYSYALASVLRAELGDLKGSDAAIKEAILSDGQNLGVKTAQAFLALKYQRQTGPNGVEFLIPNNLDPTGKASQAAEARSRTTLTRLLTDLQNDPGQNPVVDTFLSALANRLGQFRPSQNYFERAALSEPLNPDLYIERGNQLIAEIQAKRVPEAEKKGYWELAKTMFTAALTAREASAEALTGLAVVAYFQDDFKRSAELARAATQASAGYAAGWYTLAGVTQKEIQRLLALKTALTQRAVTLSSTNVVEADKAKAEAAAADQQASALLDESKTFMRTAGQLDAKWLAGRDTPNAERAWLYFQSAGRSPFMTAPR
jgi:tetratricopeptide (TPR) repeat protein